RSLHARLSLLRNAKRASAKMPRPVVVRFGPGLTAQPPCCCPSLDGFRLSPDPPLAVAAPPAPKALPPAPTFPPVAEFAAPPLAEPVAPPEPEIAPPEPVPPLSAPPLPGSGSGKGGSTITTLSPVEKRRIVSSSSALP